MNIAERRCECATSERPEECGRAALRGPSVSRSTRRSARKRPEFVEQSCLTSGRRWGDDGADPVLSRASHAEQILRHRLLDHQITRSRSAVRSCHQGPSGHRRPSAAEISPRGHNWGSEYGVLPSMAGRMCSSAICLSRIVPAFRRQACSSLCTQGAGTRPASSSSRSKEWRIMSRSFGFVLLLITGSYLSYLSPLAHT